MTFSVALMMNMVARFAGLPRIGGESSVGVSEGCSELQNGVRLGLMIVLV